jgi:hypothetical protein
LTSLLVVSLAACGSSSDGNGDGDGGPGGSHDAGNGQCSGIACAVVDCGASKPSTTLSGTVFAPNGTLPLYNVTVYVPNGHVDAFPDGVVCDRCSSILSGDPIVQTTTDTHGHFVLQNVPATQNVPLVVQVGKWRRQTVIANVPQCTETPVDAGATRLPRNKSEGDIPQMALTTGGRDALECLLRKIGLDDAEFTSSDGDGRVHLYAGTDGANKFASTLNGGADFADAQPFWSSLDNLKKYDVVFLSCEGDQNPGTKPPEALQAMHDYADQGGRVFASHWHNYWIQAGPAPWPDTMKFQFQPDLNDITADIDQSFDGGHAMADWLLNVGGSTVLGQIVLTATQHTVTEVTALAYSWIHKDQTANGTPSVQYASFTTPLTQPEEMRCGKVVFSDMHVSSGDTSRTNTPFPSGCTSTGLSPQEKALAFMVFDLAACVGPPIE